MTKSNSKKSKESTGLPFNPNPEFITDKSFIAELDKRIPYICPSETEETYDKKLIRNKTLKKSADAVGQESPIYVAVWPDDPNKDSETSEERVDGRIISGRHRYKTDPNWWKKYIWITGGLHQYLYFRMIFDHKKKDNPAEKKVVLMLQGKKLLKDGHQIEKIAATLCKLHPDMHKKQVLDLVPEPWKDSTKVANRKGKNKKNGKNIHKKCQQEIEILKDKLQNKEQEIKNLESENQALKKDNAYLNEYIKKTFRDNGM